MPDAWCASGMFSLGGFWTVFASAMRVARNRARRRGDSLGDADLAQARNSELFFTNDRKNSGIPFMSGSVMMILDDAAGCIR